MANDIYSDLAARCGGTARIGIAGGDGEQCAALNAALAREGAEGVEFCTQNYNCAICIGGAGAEGVPSVRAEELTPQNMGEVVGRLLFVFPVCAVDVNIPDWVNSLPAESSAVAELISALRTALAGITCLGDCKSLSSMLQNSPAWLPECELALYPATGRAELTAAVREEAFFAMLSETAGEEITNRSSLMSYIVNAAQASASYAKVRDALECARVTGYGIVRPSDGDLAFEKPEVVRQGGNVGVKLKASAPSYHIVKVEVSGEVSPIMGSAAQSEGMVNQIMEGFESDPKNMWNTNLFGKSLKGMVQDGLEGKVNGMHEQTRAKMRKAITRIVNEGKGGVICILL